MVDLNIAQLVRANENLGLEGGSPKKFEPPRQLSTGGAQTTRPIDFLTPGSPQHAHVIEYLLRRLRWSEQKMAQFYPRWRANEIRLQAHVTPESYERILKAQADGGAPPQPTQIVVPYMWASQQTIVTYMLHTFAGRKPIHQVGAYRGEQVKRAKNIETLLQYNSDYQRYVWALVNFFNNGELYGVAIQRNNWRREERMKTVTRAPDPRTQMLMAAMGGTAQPTRVRERHVCFEGNETAMVSPYMFFPDPRVPMVEAPHKGEFIFTRAFEGRHILLREEAAGRLKWVKYAGAAPNAGSNLWASADSAAGMRAWGDSLVAGGAYPDHSAVANNFQVDQGSVEIIPAELGLGPSRYPEKWMFTILNSRQIVQAEPLDLNHGMHPYTVAEPNSFGHAFGQLGTSDFLAPFQDLMSWLVNSHMFNVRAVLNNFLVVDPTRVEIDDLLDPQPGGILRLKPSPWGQIKPADAVMQLPMGDVTRSNLSDFQLLQRLGNDLTGASDNMRGNQDSGGRKTATEVRTSFEAAASRLAAKAMIYSAQSLTQSAAQWTSNYQQFLTTEMELAVLGSDVLGMNGENSVRITPEAIEGDYYFPIHDGTLPLDRVALLDVWQKIFEVAATEPTGAIRGQYDIAGIFDFIGQLSGAQNLSQFKITAANPEAVQQQAQAGNLVPLPGSAPGQMPSGPPMLPVAS
jgi:hypothetical protein